MSRQSTRPATLGTGLGFAQFNGGALLPKVELSQHPFRRGETYDERLFLGFIEGDLSPEDTVVFEKQMLENPRLRNLVAQLVLDRHRVRDREVSSDRQVRRVHRR